MHYKARKNNIIKKINEWKAMKKIFGLDHRKPLTVKYQQTSNHHTHATNGINK